MPYVFLMSPGRSTCDRRATRSGRRGSPRPARRTGRRPPCRRPRSRSGSRGAARAGSPMMSSRSSSQSSVRRSISSVRRRWSGRSRARRRPGPPVRFHSSQVSGVPNSRSPRSAAARRAGSWSSSHRSLSADEYVEIGSPVVRRKRSMPPSAARASASAAVRVSCHVIAWATGRPVRRSHRTTDSRSFAIPIAATSSGPRPRWRAPRGCTPGSGPRPAPCRAPPSRAAGSTSSARAARSPPACRLASNRMQRVLRRAVVDRRRRIGRPSQPSHAGAGRHAGRRLERVRRRALGRLGLELALGRLRGRAKRVVVRARGTAGRSRSARSRSPRRRRRARTTCGRPG